MAAALEDIKPNIDDVEIGAAQMVDIPAAPLSGNAPSRPETARRDTTTDLARRARDEGGLRQVRTVC